MPCGVSLSVTTGGSQDVVKTKELSTMAKSVLVNSL